jgi:hypothetical protein
MTCAGKQRQNWGRIFWQNGFAEHSRACTIFYNFIGHSATERRMRKPGRLLPGSQPLKPHTHHPTESNRQGLLRRKNTAGWVGSIVTVTGLVFPPLTLLQLALAVIPALFIAD